MPPWALAVLLSWSSSRATTSTSRPASARDQAVWSPAAPDPITRISVCITGVSAVSKLVQ